MRVRTILLSVPLVLMTLKGYSQNNATGHLPSYFEENISSKSSLVKECLENASDCFFFWTDSHLSANDGYTPQIIEHASKAWNVKTPKIVFGGDIIPSFVKDMTPFIRQYEGQCEYMKGFGRVYPARGNHDFTFKYAPGKPEGVTYDNAATSEIFRKSMTLSGVVHNNADPSSSYYYFDEKKSKIRYVVIDSSDHIKDTSVGFGIADSISVEQRRWLFRDAILGAPKKYSIVMVSHVPQFEYGTDSPTVEVIQGISAFSAHSSVVLDGEEYRFDQRKDLKLLAVFSGHLHHDMQIYQNGALHVMMMGDVRYRDFRRDPFLDADYTRKTGTVNAHAVDFVCVLKKQNALAAIRLGAGPDRLFHMSPIVLKVGDKYRLTFSPEVKRAVAYDAKADFVKNETEKYSYIWKLNHSVVSVTEVGVITAITPGEATLMVERQNGLREFYHIKVENE